MVDTLTSKKLKNRIIDLELKLAALAIKWNEELDKPNNTEEQRAVGTLIQSLDEYITRLLEIHEIKFGKLK